MSVSCVSSLAHEHKYWKLFQHAMQRYSWFMINWFVTEAIAALRTARMILLSNITLVLILQLYKGAFIQCVLLDRKSIPFGIVLVMMSQYLRKISYVALNLSDLRRQSKALQMFLWLRLKPVLELVRCAAEAPSGICFSWLSCAFGALWVVQRAPFTRSLAPPTQCRPLACCRQVLLGHFMCFWSEWQCWCSYVAVKRVYRIYDCV